MGGRKNEKLEKERGSGRGKRGRSRGRRTERRVRREKKAEREETKRVREEREGKGESKKRVIFTSVEYMVSACIGKQTKNMLKMENSKTNI